MPPKRKVHHPQTYPCPFPGCHRFLRNRSGLTKHYNTFHLASPSPTSSRHNSPAAPVSNLNDDALEDLQAAFDAFDEQDQDDTPPSHYQPARHERSLYTDLHPVINGTVLFLALKTQTVILKMISLGTPCDSHGQDIPPGSPPPPSTTLDADDWFSFRNRLEFEMADWLFKKTQMARPDINFLMEAFAAFGYEHGKQPPFVNHADLHQAIDSIPLGDAPWHSFSAQYTGHLPDDDPNPPSWMTAQYEIWTRNIHTLARNVLANPDFKDEFHAAPYREFDIHNQRHYSHFMSANWAWRQAVCNPLLISTSCSDSIKLATGLDRQRPIN